MFTRAYIVELSERALTTYVLAFAMLAVAAPTFHISIGAAFAWAILPAGLDVVRGLIAGAFGSEHTTHFTHTAVDHTPAVEEAHQLVKAA